MIGLEKPVSSYGLWPGQRVLMRKCRLFRRGNGKAGRIHPDYRYRKSPLSGPSEDQHAGSQGKTGQAALRIALFFPPEPFTQAAFLRRVATGGTTTAFRSPTERRLRPVQERAYRFHRKQLVWRNIICSGRSKRHSAVPFFRTVDFFRRFSELVRQSHRPLEKRFRLN